jgi:hypothetical protein
MEEVGMGRRRRIVLALVVALLAADGVALAQAPEEAAQAAADSWLRLVDAADYTGAWSRASSALKSATSQGEWSGAIAAARAPLGALGGRKARSRQRVDKSAATRAIGGKLYTVAGDGKYVVVQYESAFANKSPAVENVLAVEDPDGTWRVAGYGVR